MYKTMNVINVEHETVYNHFVDRQDNGHFDRYNVDMQTFINRVWNKNLGTVVAMSHSGIGADITNGFVQFISDNPMMQTRLLAYLTSVRDLFQRDLQPTIEIRSKSNPKGVENNSGYTHYITVMFRTPRFTNKAQANAWWNKLATYVTEAVPETAAA